MQEFCGDRVEMRCGFEGEDFGGEPRFEIAANGTPGKITKVSDDAVRGENGQAFAARVDEGHHREFVGSVGNELAGARAVFIAEIEGSFVAMMAIGDNQFLIGHGFLDSGDAVRFGDEPEAVNDAVFVGELGDRWLRGLHFLEDGVDLAVGLGIQQE